MISTAGSQKTAATVTFTLAHSGLDGHPVAVVGDFNGWDPGATPMAWHDGSYTATITVEPGRYRFRYLAEDGRWFNDDAADDYAPNDHGGQDGIVVVAPEITSGSDHAEDPPADPGSRVRSLGPAQAHAQVTTAGPDLGAELDLALDQDRTAGGAAKRRGRVREGRGR